MVCLKAACIWIFINNLQITVQILQDSASPTLSPVDEIHQASNMIYQASMMTHWISTVIPQIWIKETC